MCSTTTWTTVEVQQGGRRAKVAADRERVVVYWDLEEVDLLLRPG